MNNLLLLRPLPLLLALMLHAGTTTTLADSPPPPVSGATTSVFINSGTNTSNKEKAMKETRSGDWSPTLTPDEQKTIFAIAHDTLAWCVKPGKTNFNWAAYTLTPKLMESLGTFVTLKSHGALRGCIGSLQAHEALYLSVHHNAINAALNDHRFTPLQASELASLEVDVSLLSPMRDIPSPDEFKLGRQGIVMEKDGASAVYLPEVAPEQGWTREETLTSLSRKAGLPGNAWKQGAHFKVFESVVLSED
ncbi:MAG: AmmeMemoRadiSam system protein A [Lentisphaerae bacterium]|nr:AmmeMemoRadiSam system protein A [Lentisphaerota bacterium]